MKGKSSWKVLEAMDWDFGDTEPVEPAPPRGSKRPPPTPIRPKGQPAKRRPLPGMGEGTQYDPSVGWNIRNKKTGQVFTNVHGNTPMDAKKHVLATNPLLGKLTPLDLEADPMPDGGLRARQDRESPYTAAAPSSPNTSGQLGGRSRRWTANEPFEPGEPTTDQQKSVAPSTMASTGQYRKPRNAARMRDTEVDPVDIPTLGKEGATAGAMGANGPMGREDQAEAFKRTIREMMREIVRKKAGGGGYALYAPNKGKKKSPKPVGEFPTRLAAKNAELARFPPKDPEQLKKMRARLDKIKKDPKKRAAAEKQDLSGRKKPKRTGAPAHARKKKAESFIQAMARDLHERLFHEDEVPGSPWDERITALHPDAISSDRKLHSLHRGMEKACIGALGDAGKGLSKVMRGMVKVNSGDISFDPERKKTFMPVMMDVDGFEIGPVHLYIDGGHLKIEVSKEAREAIAQLEPDTARDIRGGLMSFEEDHLPKILSAQKAWAARDAYLDKLYGRLEKHAAGLSGVEHHLMKSLLTKGGKRK